MLETIHALSGPCPPGAPSVMDPLWLSVPQVMNLSVQLGSRLDFFCFMPYVTESSYTTDNLHTCKRVTLRLGGEGGVGGERAYRGAEKKECNELF